MRNPYITGPYVLGRRHYGRSDLLDRLLHGESHAYWVIGNRRIGKTSLLRQLETLALADAHLLPVFWDMQGCDSIERLGAYLADAIQERLDELLALGLSVDIVREENVLTLLPALRRTVARAGRELLLLCDETEVLLNIAGEEPESAQRLHHELTYGVGQRVVAVSTRTIYKMHEVCRSWPTSPFLTGFDMSQMLGSLDAASACALILQTQADEQVYAEPEVIDALCDLTNRHPYLLQLLCARLFQPDGSLRPVDDADLAVDPLLGGFFQNDLSALSDFERRIVSSVSERGAIDEAVLADSVGEAPGQLQRPLSELERLGYLRHVDGQWAIGNRFLANWLAGERQKASSEGARAAAESEQIRRQDTAALIEQLNDRRSRLVELEMIRARELLGVSAQVLAEIRQTEDEIRELRASLQAPLNEGKRVTEIPVADLKAQYLSIKPAIDAAIQRVLESTSFIQGPEVLAFEQAFAGYLGVSEAVGVASGTAALHLALLACGIGPGDEVITTPLTFYATAESVVQAGATPVFVDILPDSYNINPAKIEAAITPRTRAIMPVHLYGQAADMDEIGAIARRHNLRVIEDAAQAHGARYRGRHCGALGDVACFSFYPSKNLGGYGDGGMLTTNNPEIAARARRLRDHGRVGKYEHVELGWAYRLDALQAAILGAKLPYLDDWVARRRAAAQRYNELLAGCEVVTPVERVYNRHAYYSYVIRSPRRDELAAHLKRFGIGAVIHYPIPMHLQPVYAPMGLGRGSFPVSEASADQVLSLPMYAEITPEQQARVADAVRAFVG